MAVAIVALTVNNADTTPPTVSLTAPANGAQVVGPLTVAASASDNVGVVGVTFLRNGTALGPEDTSAPDSIIVQTDYTQTGAWTLVARARDAAGNTTTAAISVVVDNATAPLLNPGAYSVTQGAYQSGTIASLVSDDNGYLAIRSATSGWIRYATTDFEITGVPSTVSRLDFSVVVKSSASNTTLRIYVFHVPSQSWTQLNSSTVGTSESRKDVSIPDGAAGYRDAAGRVRLRVEGRRFFSSFTLSHELISLIARN